MFLLYHFSAVFATVQCFHDKNESHLTKYIQNDICLFFLMHNLLQTANNTAMLYRNSTAEIIATGYCILLRDAGTCRERGHRIIMTDLKQPPAGGCSVIHHSGDRDHFVITVFQNISCPCIHKHICFDIINGRETAANGKMIAIAVMDLVSKAVIFN